MDELYEDDYENDDKILEHNLKVTGLWIVWGIMWLLVLLVVFGLQYFFILLIIFAGFVIIDLVIE
jgi:hypothetical protein